MKKEQYDIKTENFDLVINNGDFVIAESTRQHQEHILIANKGEYRQYPYVGVGIREYLLDDEHLYGLSSEIQRQFSLDGLNIEVLDIKSIDNIHIVAYYE